MQPCGGERINVHPRTAQDRWYTVSKLFLFTKIIWHVFRQSIDAITLSHPGAGKQYLIPADCEWSENFRPIREEPIFPFTDARPVRIEYVVNRNNSRGERRAICRLEIRINILWPMAPIDVKKAAGRRRVFGC